jgi:radical SAM superfamily enzyme YgiQ (UPF0313 family)
MPKVLFLKPSLGAASRSIVRDFVYGCWCNGRRVGGMQMPPLNDLYVVTHCRAQGLAVDFLDAQLEPRRFEALMAAGMEDYDVVVLMTSTQSFASDAAAIGAIKAVKPGLTAVLYGSHPTFMPESCLADPRVDHIVLREPEQSMRELLAALCSGADPVGIPGTGSRVDGRPVLGPARDFLDMDDLPIPDRSLLPKGIDYFNPVVKRMPYTTMQTSRGCPGKCIFCTAPSFYGRRVRCRSARMVLEELGVIKDLGYREVMFRDETFTVYKSRNREICQGMLDRKLDLSWIANGRVDSIDKETMQLMKRAGCHLLKFGVETGSDALLANYRKGTTTAQARQVFAWAREVGLDTHAHIVFGGPGETAQTMDRTIEFVKEIGATTASFGILTPYPGTELFNMVAAQSRAIGDGSGSTMENLHVSGFFSEEICGIPGPELLAWITKAYRRFYLRPGYLVRRLTSIRGKDEFVALTIAGLNVLRFALTGEK